MPEDPRLYDTIATFIRMSSRNHVACIVRAGIPRIRSLDGRRAMLGWSSARLFIRRLIEAGVIELGMIRSSAFQLLVCFAELTFLAGGDAFQDRFSDMTR